MFTEFLGRSERLAHEAEASRARPGSHDTLARRHRAAREIVREIAHRAFGASVARAPTAGVDPLAPAVTRR